MAIELGRVNVQDLSENDYKSLGISINKTSNTNGVFDVNYTTLSQVKYNLINLILTRKGERVMQPTFGCDIWRILFEPIVEGQIDSEIERTIIEAVGIWLPYINIDRILFDYDENDIDNHRINLELQFSLASNPAIRDSVIINVNA
jgi:phage baseplate assembly protein W